MADPILKIKNLNVEYPLFGGILQKEVSCVHAVKNLSIDIPEGETVGIVGESGSGKSTLGKAILNVLNLTAPDVRISGEVLLNEKGKYVDIMSLTKKRISLLQAKNANDIPRSFFFIESKNDSKGYYP